MILPWSDLVFCYGDDVAGYRERFAKAGDATYALLCCRLTPSNTRLGASGGDHAERKLVSSHLWSTEMAAALNNRVVPEQAEVVVTLVINRTPCRGCAVALADSLVRLHRSFPVRANEARFVLACRGAYEEKPNDEGYYENATTMGDLRRLRNADWELCVLQVGELPPSGLQLLQALTTVGGET